MRPSSMKNGKVFTFAILSGIFAVVIGTGEVHEVGNNAPRTIEMPALPAKLPAFNFMHNSNSHLGSRDEHSEDRGMDLTGVLGQRAMMSEKGRKISTCSVCFETGHNKRKCPQELQRNEADGSGKRKRGDGTCSICFSREHNKRTCPVERTIQDLASDSAEDADNEQTNKRKALLSLAQAGNASSLSYLIRQGSHVDGCLRPSHRRCETPLHRAALFNHSDAVQKLLELGANINAADEHAFTPLHVAAFRGFEGIVEVLLAHKADVNANDEAGYTPLHYAAKQGWQGIVNELLIAGADPDAATTKRKLTPLMLAAMLGQEACVLQLTYGGASFSQRDDRARTAHAWAAALGQRSAARLIDTLAAHPNPTELLDPGDAWKEIAGLAEEGLHDAWRDEPLSSAENLTESEVAALEAGGISVVSGSVSVGDSEAESSETEAGEAT